MASTKQHAIPSTTKRKTSEQETTATIAVIREHLATILATKKALTVKAKDDGKPTPEELQAFKDTLVSKTHVNATNISIAFSDLKGSNRDAQTDNETKKNEVLKEKQQLNQFNLQLQNILYEKNHFLKEIKQCRDFTFNEKDHNLIPLETFMSQAPTELTSTSDPHQLMLNRLNYEIQERKRLCEQIQELKARKKALNELNANKQKFLTTLPEKLNTITQASLPIQAHMGISTYRDAQMREVAQLLPPPLYNLFAQATAFKAVHASGRDIEVLIVGNYEEAVALQATKDPLKQEEETTSVVIVAEEIKTASPHADDSDDEEREMRHSTVLESAKEDSQAEEKPQKGLSKEEYYKPFPLAVFIEFKSKEPKEKSIGIRFDYLPALFVTTACATSTVPPIATPTPPSVSITSPPLALSSSSSSASTPLSSSSSSSSSLVEDRHLLANLFHNDTGLTSPNPATYIALSSATFSPPEPPCQGLPYTWAQWLTGSTTTHPSPSPFTSLPATYTAVLAAVRARLASRVAVRSQIESLAKLSVPERYNKRGFPLPTEFVLVMWKEIQRYAFEEVEHVPEPEDKGAADREEGECPASPPTYVPSTKPSSSGLHFADDVSISGTHIPWEKVGARYFRAVLQRAETQVEALIEIASDYPTRPPHFKLKTILRLPSSTPQVASSSSSSSSSASTTSTTSSTPVSSAPAVAPTIASSSSIPSSAHAAKPPHVPHMSFPFANPLLPHVPLAAPHMLPTPFGIPPHFALLPHLANLHHNHPLHMQHTHMPPTTVLSTPSSTTILFPHGTSNHINSPLAPHSSTLASSSSSTTSSKGKEKEKEAPSKEQAIQQIMQQQRIDHFERLLPADNHIKSIETEVNTQTSEWLLDNDPNNLLSTQIRKLQQCLDVYFEFQVVVKENSSMTSSGQSAQGASVREGKLCARTYRGRARLLPLVFNEAIGLFDQRSYSS